MTKLVALNKQTRNQLHDQKKPVNTNFLMNHIINNILEKKLILKLIIEIKQITLENQ